MRDIEKYEDFYSNSPFETYKVKYRRKMVIERIGLYKHSNILEIGCGSEPLFKFFDDYEKMTVVEPGDGFFQIAEEAALGNKRIRLHKGFFEDVYSEIKDNPYDIILISGLLHEVERPCELLKCTAQTAHENTVIHINVPNARSFHRILGKEMGIISDVMQKTETNIRAQQHSVFNMETLEEIAEKSGLKIIAQGSFFVKPFSHAKMQELLDKKIFDETLLDALDKMAQYMPEYASEIFIDCNVNH